jgi:HK97 family phage prohead protease
VNTNRTLHNIETFRAPSRVRFAAGRPGHFTCMAMPFFGVIDCDPPSTVTPGAFAKTIKEQSRDVKILWQHLTEEPIGRPVRMEETPAGLLVEGQLDVGVGVELADRAAAQVESGTVASVSIGFSPVRAETVNTRDLIARFGTRATQACAAYTSEGVERVRVLLEVRLYEISLVTWPAARGAAILPAQQAKLERKARIQADLERLRQAEAELARRGLAIQERELVISDLESRLRGRA